MRRYDNKAFTILELLVAMGLLVAMLAISGMVFKMAVDAYRRAEATGEVTRRLRAVVNQLDADFKGLQKDGHVVMVWVPVPMDAEGNGLPPTTPLADIHHYGRFDRMMFFANGNFQSYSPQPPQPNPIPIPVTPETLPIRNNAGKLVQGNIARVTYMIANDSADVQPGEQTPKTRILARNQLIQVSDRELIGDPEAGTGKTYPLDILNITGTFIHDYIHKFEYENISYLQWLSMPEKDIALALTRLLDVQVKTGQPADDPQPLPDDGLTVDADPAKNIHMLMCEGVGSFAVQGWFDSEQRWYPEVDLNHDGQYAQNDTDFNWAGSAIDLENLKGDIWYPQKGPFESERGLGRALKFTFTLYDSQGVFKNGKTFTHIIYLK